MSRALENESGPEQDTSAAYKTTYGQHYRQLETVREEKITGQSSQEKRRAEDYAQRRDTSGFFLNPFS